MKPAEMTAEWDISSTTQSGSASNGASLQEFREFSCAQQVCCGRSVVPHRPPNIQPQSVVQPSEAKHCIPVLRPSPRHLSPSPRSWWEPSWRLKCISDLSCAARAYVFFC